MPPNPDDRHTELERYVALKLLLTEGVPSPRAVQRFKREARVLLRAVADFFQLSGEHFQRRALFGGPRAIAFFRLDVILVVTRGVFGQRVGCGKRVIVVFEGPVT